MDFKDIVEFVKDLSVIIGLWITFYKIGSWQIEHRGRRNIELAEETLSLFYEAQDVIEWIRHPLGFEDETSSLVKNDKESEAEFQARKRANFIFVRYNQNKELFSKIHSLRYRFMSQIGKEKAKPFNELNALLREIISAARFLIMMWPEDNFRNEEDRKKHYEEIKKKEKIIWDEFSDQDPIKPKLTQIVKSIEEICQEVIVCKGSIHGFLNQKI